MTASEMQRSSKRSRKAAGKSLGDMCATQKALATVGSSVRGGASASMVSSTVAVLPILFFSGLVACNFWKTAPPLAAVPSELLAFEFEAGSPSPPPGRGPKNALRQKRVKHHHFAYPMASVAFSVFPRVFKVAQFLLIGAQLPKKQKFRWSFLKC